MYLQGAEAEDYYYDSVSGRIAVGRDLLDGDNHDNKYAAEAFLSGAEKALEAKLSDNTIQGYGHGQNEPGEKQLDNVERLKIPAAARASAPVSTAVEFDR